MKRKFYILYFCLLYHFSFVLGQFQLPEFGSTIPVGSVYQYDGNQYNYVSQSFGSSIEPAPGGWYYAETYVHTAQLAAMGMDPYSDCHSRIMRFDTSGAPMWPDWIAQAGSSNIVTLSSGNILWIGDLCGFFDFGNSFNISCLDISGNILWDIQGIPNMLSPANYRSVYSGIELASGRLLVTAPTFMRTINPVNGNSMPLNNNSFANRNAIYAMYPAPEDAFFAITDSGLYKFDTLGNILRQSNFYDPNALMAGKNGDTLYWTNLNQLFIGDTNFVPFDSVLLTQIPKEIQISSQSIWIFYNYNVEEYLFDLTLNRAFNTIVPDTTYSSTPVYHCYSENRIITSGYRQTAFWKTCDLNGTTIDEYDAEISNFMISNPVYTPVPYSSGGWFSCQIQFDLKNNGTQRIDSIGCRDYYRNIMLYNLNLLPGQSTSVSFSRGSSYPLPPNSIPLNIGVFTYSPNGKVDRDISNNIASAAVSYTVANDPFEPLTKIFIYPIPTHNELVIEGLSEKLPYSIISIQGNTISTGITDEIETRISVIEIPSGIYFLRIRNENSQTTKKFIVNH